MKEFFHKVKILYDNKKYRNLVILLGYLVFFSIVILMMQYNARHKSINDVITKITLDNMQSYAYKYAFTSTKENENYVIEGIRYEDKERLVYNKEVFYIINNNLYEIKNDKLNFINDNLVLIKLLKLNSNNLNKIINAANKDYVINDEIVTEKYTISVNHFLQLYDDIDLDVTNDKNIFITLYKKDNVITSIELDLTNYFNANYQYKLLIEYSSINKINSLDIPYKLEENIEE